MIDLIKKPTVYFREKIIKQEKFLCIFFGVHIFFAGRILGSIKNLLDSLFSPLLLLLIIASTLILVYFNSCFRFLFIVKWKRKLINFVFEPFGIFIFSVILSVVFETIASLIAKWFNSELTWDIFGQILCKALVVELSIGLFLGSFYCIFYWIKRVNSIDKIIKNDDLWRRYKKKSTVDLLVRRIIVHSIVIILIAGVIFLVIKAIAE